MEKCPKCNNEDELKIRCIDKELDGNLTYKCFKCHNKFKINKKEELLLKTIEEAKQEERERILDLVNGGFGLNVSSFRKYLKENI